MAKKSRKEMVSFSVQKMDDILAQNGLKRQQASRILYDRDGYLGDRCLEATRGIGRMSKERLKKFCDYFHVDYEYLTTRPYNRKDSSKEEKPEPLEFESNDPSDNEQEQVPIVRTEDRSITLEEAFFNFAGRMKEAFGFLENDLWNVGEKLQQKGELQ